MGWYNLLDHQLVDGTNLQEAVNDKVFLLNAGQSISKADKVILRGEANTEVQILTLPNDNRGVKKSELIPFWRSKPRTEYFQTECGDTYSPNVPFSITEGQFTSLLSPEDADNIANAWLMIQGQANADANGVCSLTYSNEKETRIYYSQVCAAPALPEPYPITLAANTYSDTDPDVVIAAVNSWFTANGQSQANSLGTCTIPDQEVIVYVTTGNPCTSPRTATRIYYKASENKYYLDAAKTVLANMHFFAMDNIIGGFKQIVAGVVSESTTYAACSVPVTIRYADMGTPADMSIYNNILIACYPKQHVVVKYDTSTGTNPIGTIVAGQLNTVCKSPAETTLLNTPMLVQWREDGGRFAVYSAGAFKTIKTFYANGTFHRSTSFTNSPADSQWAYDAPIDEGDYYTVPTSSASLVGILTAQTATLNNFWMPVSMEYGKSDFLGEFNDTETDTIFLGLWNKTTANANRFKVYGVSIFSYSGGSTNSQTNLLHTDNGFATQGLDLIRGLKLVKTISIASSSVTYKLAIVTPYAIAKSKANDKRRFYDLHYLDINVQRADTALSVPIVSIYTSLTYVNSYRINTSTSGIWKNNVKAEVTLRNNTLVVIIKSSNDSLWNILVRSAAATTIGAAVGALSLLTAGVAAGWLTDTAVIGILGFTPAGVIIGALIIAAVIIFSPPPQRYLGGTALVFTYSGTAFSSISFNNGSYSQSSWITNKIEKPRTIYMNSEITGTAITLYSMANGRIIRIGNWNADNASSQITI